MPPQRLLFLGGPPGVGKSTVAPLLADRLAPCAWVEGDELWRMSPTLVTDRTRRMVESNIAHVVNGLLGAGYDNVFMSWVLHRRDVIERLLCTVTTTNVTRTVAHLVASPEVLRKRVMGEPSRSRSVERALDRLAQIEALPYERVDTSELTPRQVADRVAEIVQRVEG